MTKTFLKSQLNKILQFSRVFTIRMNALKMIVIFPVSKNIKQCTILSKSISLNVLNSTNKSIGEGTLAFSKIKSETGEFLKKPKHKIIKFNSNGKTIDGFSPSMKIHGLSIL